MKNVQDKNVLAYKNKIFISYIEEEKDITKLLKDLIGSAFRGIFYIFAYSTREKEPFGEVLSEDIINNIKNCKFVFIICSPKSISKPWINFEAGAGSVANLVIPLCHSGMEPGKLPSPLNSRYGANLTNYNNLADIFSMLAKEVGILKPPNTNFTHFIKKIEKFERDYTYWTDINSALKVLKNEYNFEPNCFNSDNKQLYLHVIHADERSADENLNILKRKKFINYFKFEGVVGEDKPVKDMVPFIISKGDDFDKIISDEKCILNKS